nr:hypothetical protein Iba_chr15dCG6970 [Ipomoea batatas]
MILLWPPVGLETLTDMQTLRGADSPINLLSFDSIERATINDLGGATEGGPNISFPLSSLHFASDNCFLILRFDSLSRVPLNSRCFATSCIVVFVSSYYELPHQRSDLQGEPYRLCQKVDEKYRRLSEKRCRRRRRSRMPVSRTRYFDFPNFGLS